MFLMSDFLITAHPFFGAHGLQRRSSVWCRSDSNRQIFVSVGGLVRSMIPLYNIPTPEDVVNFGGISREKEKPLEGLPYTTKFPFIGKTIGSNISHGFCLGTTPFSTSL